MPRGLELRTARICLCFRLSWPPHSPIMGPHTLAPGTTMWPLGGAETLAHRQGVTAMARPQPRPAGHPIDRLLGHAPAMADLRATIRHLAPFDALGSALVPSVVLQGETGTGKGLVARVLHESGPRAHGPCIEVNCAAIPETLLEAELFGFAAGAFTDARHAKPGLFEAASGGTLFLDEIDALPLPLQAKLLQTIEQRWVRRLGAVAEHPIDVKIIAATQSELGASVAQGRFRADLYHRLARSAEHTSEL